MCLLQHEKLIHELEEERHLRLQSEKRLQEVTLESERNRIQMRGLQQQFSRYCSVRSILLPEVHCSLYQLHLCLNFPCASSCYI